MATTVVNVKVKHLRPKYDNLQKWMSDPNNVYIGRGGVVFIDGQRFPPKASIWANPFKVGDDRESAVDKYRKYITAKIREDPEQYDLATLRGKTLGCWCKPDACHGDVLKELIDGGDTAVNIDSEQLIESDDEVVAEPQVKTPEFQVDIKQNFLIVSPKSDDIGKTRIAAFDLDSTLITPLPGRHQFDRDPANWRWFRPNVPERLVELSRQGYHIAIISNQGVHALKRVASERSEHPLVKKFKNIAENLASQGVLVNMIACVGRGAPCRKPAPDMWHHLIRYKGWQPPTEAFFVGDAAGRTGDHGDCDSEFAKALGIPFHLPEEFFKKKERPKVSPKKQGAMGDAIPQEMVILTGYPGSGKTTLAHRVFPDYAIIAQDVTHPGAKRGTRGLPAVYNDIQQALSRGRSVVVDRTNPSPDNRAPFIAMAKRYKVPVRCLFIDVDLETSYKRNVARHEKDPNFPKIAKVVYYKMRKILVPPDPSEGCQVVTVDDPDNYQAPRDSDVGVEVNKDTLIRQLASLTRANLQLVLAGDQAGDPVRQLYVDRVRTLLAPIQDCAERTLLINKAIAIGGA